MNFFLVLSCVLAFAAADVSHLISQGAYEDSHSSHHSTGGHATSGVRFESHGGAYSGADSYATSGFQSSGTLETGRSGFLDYSSGSVGGVHKIVKPVIKHGEPIVSKAFYLHEAPADEARGVEVETKEHVVRPRKHYNVVFVKTPVAGSNSINSNNVNVFPENEEKTIVYVLTGRNDGVTVNENGEIQLPQPKTPSKPEVVFVKYNNEADAQRAISDIQNQYNSQSGASVSVIGAGNSAPTSGIRSTVDVRSFGTASVSSSGSASVHSSSGAASFTEDDKQITTDPFDRNGLPLA